MVLLYSACKKDNIPSKITDNNNNNNNTSTTPPYHINMPDSADNNMLATASLNVHANTTSPVVPDDFLGFSFEKQIMTDPTYFNASNTSFINMFKNLDNGLIRIGGATVDMTFFSGNQHSGTRLDTVFSDDVDRYKAFVQTVGWKTIWGLNLGSGTPAEAATEASYVSKNMGNQIASFAIGNEPQYLYTNNLRPPSYTLNDYVGEFNSFSSVVKGSVPGAVFSGPENELSGIGGTFLQAIAGKINMLTLHYYRMGPANSPGITMDALMTFDPGLQGLAYYGVQDTQPMNIPYRITECNSVWAGGQQNMSNAYASALWGSEFLFYLAHQGAAGINFHTGGPPNYVYSPINTVNGKSVARPLYYAMLLFHQANISQFTNNNLTNSSNINMDAYSFITKDKKKGVLIINKDLATDLSITINNNNTPVQTATVYQLIGPYLASLTGTNINGSTVNDDGVFSVNGQQFDLSQKYTSVVAKVKPTSAMLIVLD